MSEEFHRKYRPEKLDEVFGQDHIVKSLEVKFKSKKIPHACLFIGESGTGKTTLARIIANELGCTNSKNIIELDVGVYTGVDKARELITYLKYPAMGKVGIKYVILDEVHMASKSFFNAFLKILEEPQKHVYFALCTTEGEKIPQTIKTRCLEFNLREVDEEELEELIDCVVGEEEIEIPKEASALMAREAQGSPRRALRLLEKCVGCETIEEIKDILESIEDSEEVIALCRLLVSKELSWKKASKLLKKLKESNAEGVRIQIINYLKACLLNSSDRQAEKFMFLMSKFLEPFSKSTGMAELAFAIGEVCIGGDE
jgi:DNA polymerase-3 subunit gamma/tau